MSYNRDNFRYILEQMPLHRGNKTKYKNENTQALFSNWWQNTTTQEQIIGSALSAELRQQKLIEAWLAKKAIKTKTRLIYNRKNSLLHQ